MTLCQPPGIDAGRPEAGRRMPARSGTGWTQRQPHLAGALPAPPASSRWAGPAAGRAAACASPRTTTSGRRTGCATPDKGSSQATDDQPHKPGVRGAAVPHAPRTWKLRIPWKLRTHIACFISAGCKVSTLTGRPGPDGRATARRTVLKGATPPSSYRHCGWSQVMRDRDIAAVVKLTALRQGHSLGN